jgi:hypothetical protein
MSEDQQLEADLGKVSSEREPWTEAWEQAWKAYQGQQKPGRDEKSTSFRNPAKQENDARYLGEKYMGIQTRDIVKDLSKTGASPLRCLIKRPVEIVLRRRRSGCQ